MSVYYGMLWQTDTYYKISKTVYVIKYRIENLYFVFFHSLAQTASLCFF